MAVSCPEVMYGAYYPYLYGRGARPFPHAPPFQYDRLNVQSGGGHAGAESYGAGAVGSLGAMGAVGPVGAGGAALSSSSSGAQSPGSPPHAHVAHHARLRAKDEELSAHGRASADGGGSSESEGECGGALGASGGAGAGARAQYVSANCVVFTHYSGDVAAVVDEHFSRALSLDKPKESLPMVSRNLPASFFNAAAGGAGGVELYEYDPWHPGAHYGGYGRHAAEYHAAHAAHAHHAHHVGYGGLLLGRGALHHQYKPVEWGAQHLDPAPYSYAPVHGLEAQVQDTSKDLYWF